MRRKFKKMQFAIYRDKENIITTKDFRDIGDLGEITQMIAELEVIKQELVRLFIEYKEKEKYGGNENRN